MMVHQSIDVRVSAAEIYSVAQDIENWPRILPHYTGVRIVVETCDERVAVMSARRDWIPVRWTASQQLLPAIPRIEFIHLSGWATGMRVAWIFDPTPHGTKVTITHDLASLRLPIVRSRLGREIVAEYFIANIASRTLAAMKTVVEARHD